MPGATQPASCSSVSTPTFVVAYATRSLASLDQPLWARADGDGGSEQPTARAGQLSAEHDIATLDARFAELRDSANVLEAFDPETEDLTVPPLLRAGLESWMRERGDANDGSVVRGTAAAHGPAGLHACLRMMVDARIERQRRWSFRAIGAEHARSVQSRLRKAMMEARLDGESPDRRLFVLRNEVWPNGAVTKRITAELADRGGVALTLTAEDLKTFAALGAMLGSGLPQLDTWLAVRRPAHGTELFRRALDDVAMPEPAIAVQVKRKPSPDSPQSTGQPVDQAVIRIGTTTVGRGPANVDLASLRKHLAIIAGSGSGKTVLLRRVVEERARWCGVSAIVLDSGGDLSRLGDPWPEPPETWGEGDADRARDYLANTDVLVWTPRIPRGRPLTFQPLPVFTDLRDDVGELDAAVETAIEALAPQAQVTGGTSRARQEKAVLTSALRHFARTGSGGLAGFIAMLSDLDLPEDDWTLGKSSEIAAELAERLKAARINDPLFGGSGQSADPGVLLTPPSGKRARISVISMIGLRGQEQRQSFVNQLQMAVFSWINKHPARDGQLGGLFVMDEAQDLVPSRGVTVCTESTIRLASQARKYGLGLLFATQSPTESAQPGTG